MVTIVWETWLKQGSEDEGLALTHRIWTDMTHFLGYVSHFVLRDEDEKGTCLLLVSGQAEMLQTVPLPSTPVLNLYS